VDDLIAAVEQRLEDLEKVPDRVARESATELVQALLAMYGEGLARVFGQLDEPLVRDLASDELVEHLLFLHDLHPVPVDERVQSALAEVRPYLQTYGCGVELLGIDEGVVRVRLSGGTGCGGSMSTMRAAVEQAIAKAAPDVEGVDTSGEPAVPTIQLQMAGGAR